MPDERERPRFAIINTCDAPCRRHVCQWIDGLGYCYMARELEPHLKRYDGMKPSMPTPIEAFGFSVESSHREARFIRVGPSTATYEDGKPRKWQDAAFDEIFTLPLVKLKRRRRSVPPSSTTTEEQGA
jgi:hypothetical protein